MGELLEAPARAGTSRAQAGSEATVGAAEEVGGDHEVAPATAEGDRSLIYAVAQSCDAGLLGAAGTAEHPPVRLETMADDPATAVLAGGSERVNRALEAVEDVRLASEADLEGLVVFVPADLAAGHTHDLPERSAGQTSEVHFPGLVGLGVYAMRPA
jgi:N-acetylmuramic acid 6-phosphate (MurNAc-6-P) etherase